MSGHPSNAAISALAKLQQAIEGGSKDPDTLVKYGALLFEPFHELGRAREVLERAVEMDPNSAFGRFWLAEVLDQLVEYAAARAHLEAALAVVPQRADCLCLLASVLRELKVRVEPRLALARRAVAAEPLWVRTHELLAAVAREAGDYALAKEELEKAITLAENQPTKPSPDPMTEFYEEVVTGRSLSPSALQELKGDLQLVRRELSRKALYSQLGGTGREEPAE